MIQNPAFVFSIFFICIFKRENKDKLLKWQTDKIHGSNLKKKKKKHRKSELRKVDSGYITEPVSKRNLHLEAFYDC